MKPDAEQSDIDSGAVQADDSTIDFRPAPEMWGADTENVNATTANIFFKIFGKNMSHHVLHKDLYLSNGDAIVQIYEVLAFNSANGDSEPENVTVSSAADGNTNIAMLTWILGCQFNRFNSRLHVVSRPVPSINSLN